MDYFWFDERPPTQLPALFIDAKINRDTETSHSWFCVLQVMQAVEHNAAEMFLAHFGSKNWKRLFESY